MPKSEDPVKDRSPQVDPAVCESLHRNASKVSPTIIGSESRGNELS